MAIGISNYSQFYRGMEQLNRYGSKDGKDTLVKYEFNTVDEDGNKLMDKLSREETLQAMKDISSQYGDNVIVQFSGEGLAKLIEGGKGYLNKSLNEDETASRARKQAAFESEIVHLQGTNPIAENGFGVILNDENYYNSMISGRMPSTYGEKNAEGEYERIYYSASEDADNLLRAYADAYDEIQRGYADGTRVAYAQDENSETGYRQLTKDEEIDNLNKAYERQIKLFERRNDPKIISALEENAKKLARFKASGSKGVMGETVDELEKRKAELEKLPKDMGQKLLDAARLFTKNYNLQKQGIVDVTEILRGISIFGLN